MTLRVCVSPHSEMKVGNKRAKANRKPNNCFFFGCVVVLKETYTGSNCKVKIEIWVGYEAQAGPTDIIQFIPENVLQTTGAGLSTHNKQQPSKRSPPT